MIKRLSWDNMLSVLRALESEGYEVFSPRINRFGDWFPEPGIPDEPPKDFLNYFFPFLKEAVFPTEEPLFFRYGEAFLPYENEVRNIAFFAARPCDSTALSYTDHFFMRRFFPDSRYKARRRSLFVITMACQTPCPNSFCVAARAGPWARKGFDIQIYPDGEGWLAEARTSAGQLFISPYDEAERDDLVRVRREIEKGFPDEGNLPRHRVKDHELNQWIAERCFRCGACVWLCPTCTCYNQSQFGKEGVKREQDPCLFEGYHRLAGGSSLRPTQADRMDFRYECKFGVGACVGCGRCSLGCVGYAAMEAYFDYKGSRTT
jgi:ferredoxin